ncbi:MAG: helix-turn-helix domain-containing protein [Planctomycetes bacterium]|nr:helix-turn-helix domain-containing protein [Planctomycetota bacterium]
MKLDEAAEYLGVSRPTLDRWIRQGLMAEAGLRGSRFDRDVLVAWSRRRGMCPTARAGGPGAAPENLLAEAVERGAVTRVEGAADAGAVIEGACARARWRRPRTRRCSRPCSSASAWPRRRWATASRSPTRGSRGPTWSRRRA